MSDCEAQRKILQTHRARLQVRLRQLAVSGSLTDPAILIDINAIRGEIRQRKTVMRALGCSLDDLPDDYEPDADAPASPRDDLSSGVELFEANPRFQEFYCTARLSALIDQVHARPCYHVIEAPMGRSKTALAGALWRSFAAPTHLRLVYLSSAVSAGARGSARPSARSTASCR